MVVKNFISECAKYENFAIWDVENMNSFFEGNKVLSNIFETDFKMSVGEFEIKRSEIEQSNMQIMESLLDQVGDKHFYVFTYHNANHQELIHMQDTKVMDFGIDIKAIDKEHVYIVIMDKKA